MSAPRRIWVDVTGIQPGSDSAVFAERLIGGFSSHSVETVLCCRDPGLRVFRWPEPAPTHAPRTPLAGATMPVWRRAWDGLPSRTRGAIRRFVRLQKAVVVRCRERRRRAVGAQMPAMSDAARPGRDDVVLMLGAFGDASRFADAGVRLALLLVDATSLSRREWLTRSQNADVEVWLRTSRPRLSWAFSAAGCPGWGRAVTPVAGAAVLVRGTTDLPGPSRPFVLAAGPIGAAGQTRHLLLAWRRLMDTMEHLPDLVIAGEVGRLADDVLAQIHNSDGLGGSVTVVRAPSIAAISMLMRACLFCIATEVPGGWGRAALDAAAAGKPCLVAGAQAENAAQLALDIAWFLTDPPAAATPSARRWDDVARDVLEGLSG